MTTQYTPILKLALPVTGELSGTWGDVVNDNITSMIEQAIAGLATISTWSANAHTLSTANGTTSESRCAMLVAQDGAGLAAAGEIICPASSKLYVLKNATSYQLTLKTSGGSGIAVASGETAFLFCDGTNVNACVTTIINGHITGNLTVDGNATVNGNTTLGNATSDTITATARFASGLIPSADNTYDLGSTANSWKDLYIDGTATMALVAISGGTINGVSIGATTPATFLAVDNLSLDGNTIASTNTNGNIVIAPNGTGDVQLDADTVRVGDSGAAATLTSNGAGALTVTTGGAADLTLSTNSGTTSGTITIANGANGNITLTPNGTGDVVLSADTTQIGDSNTDAYLTTNGTGNLNLTTNNGTNSGTIQIAQGANGNITLTPNGTGSVSVPKLVWSNGTATRVPYLTTGGQFTDDADMTFDGTTLTVGGLSTAGSVTLSGGTANGVAYLNGSKVLTTGSALTFDGTKLKSSGSSNGATLRVLEIANDGAGANTKSQLAFTANNTAYGYIDGGYGALSPVMNFQLPSGTPGAFIWGTSGSAEDMRLTSTGLGIGTSSPGYKLDVNGATQITSASGTNLRLYTASGAPLIQFYPNAAGGRAQTIYSTDSSSGLGGGLFVIEDTASSNRLVFAGASGNLGIGTSSPGYKLDVQGTTAVDLRVFATDNSTGKAKIYLRGGTSNFSFETDAANGTNYLFENTSGQIAYRYFAGASGYWQWYTAGSERMRLDTSGNLGIGTSSPQSKLSIYTADASSKITLSDSTVGNGYGGVLYGYGVAGTGGYMEVGVLDGSAGYTKGIRVTQQANSIQFFTGTTSAGNAEKMRLDASGNLGIGTSSPGARLDVFTGSTEYKQLVLRNAGDSDRIYMGAVAASVGSYIQNNAFYNSSYNFTPNDPASEGIHFQDGIIWFSTNTGLTSGVDFIPTERMRLDSSGNLLVGTTSVTDAERLNVTCSTTSNGIRIQHTATAGYVGMLINRNASDGKAIVFARAGTEVGSISVTTTATAYNTSSDYRLKEDIQPMTGALAKVTALKPVTYKWKADGSDGEGFIAHELAEVCPQAVTGEKDAVDADGNPKYQGIDTSFLVATLTAAIQEQQAIIEQLKARLDAANL